MGLTTWKNAPAGPIRKGDVVVAKNYLTQEEIRELNRVVTMYLDFAEDQARRRKPMHMAEWVERLIIDSEADVEVVKPFIERSFRRVGGA